MNNGSPYATIPINETRISQITESGNNMIVIDDSILATLDGSKLIFQPEVDTKNQDGAVIQMVITRTGTLGNGIIAIKETYSGSYQPSGVSGILIGSANVNITKK